MLEEIFMNDGTGLPIEPALQKILSYSENILESARDVNDQDVITIITQRILVTAAILREIVGAFQQMPTARISEIARQLDRSTACLWITFASCGIDYPKQLRDPNVRVSKLLRANRVHGPLIDLLLRTRGSYLIFSQELENSKETLLLNWEDIYK